VIDKLFSKSEIAGRHPPGKRTGEFCPRCGTAGYERHGVNFGLCQLEITHCRDGRPVTPRASRVTRPDNPSILVYDVCGLKVMEVDSPSDRSAVYVDGPNTFRFDPGVVLGYTVEEWQGDVKLSHATADQFARDMRSSINMVDMTLVRRIQILHADKIVRVEHTPF